MTPTGTVLDTARFTLTPLAETDRYELFAHLADPGTVEYMDIKPLSDLTGADAIIAWAVSLLERDKVSVGRSATPPAALSGPPATTR